MLRNRPQSPAIQLSFSAGLADRQRSEQKRTLSQSRAHFLRQLNGKPQAAHCLEGNWAFLTILGIGASTKPFEYGKKKVASPERGFGLATSERGKRSKEGAGRPVALQFG